MEILRIILIVISALVIIFNGLYDNDDYKARFIINGIFLMYLIYLLFA